MFGIMSRSEEDLEVSVTMTRFEMRALVQRVYIKGMLIGLFGAVIFGVLINLLVFIVLNHS